MLLAALIDVHYNVKINCQLFILVYDVDMKEETMVYLDMDGVLCDFEKEFQKISHGVLPRDYEAEHSTKKYWNLVLEQGTGFWENMETTPDMIELKEYVFSNFLKIGILSSSSRKEHGSNIPTQGKMKFLRKHGFLTYIPKENVKIVDSAQQKKNYAWSNKILVDDYDKNIRAWKGAGGIGILHTSARQTIKELNRYA